MFIIVGKENRKPLVNLCVGGKLAISQKKRNGETQALALVVRTEKIASRFKSSNTNFFSVLIISLSFSAEYLSCKFLLVGTRDLFLFMLL